MTIQSIVLAVIIVGSILLVCVIVAIGSILSVYVIVAYYWLPATIRACKTARWMIRKFIFEYWAERYLVKNRRIESMRVAWCIMRMDYRKYGWKVVEGRTDWDDSYPKYGP